MLKENERLRHGEKLTLVHHKPTPFIFQDVFRHVDIDLPKVANSRFILMKNNIETGFHEEIHPGDDLRIMWPAMVNNQHSE